MIHVTYNKDNEKVDHSQFENIESSNYLDNRATANFPIQCDTDGKSEYRVSEANARVTMASQGSTGIKGINYSSRKMSWL